MKRTNLSTLIIFACGIVFLAIYIAHGFFAKPWTYRVDFSFPAKVQRGNGDIVATLTAGAKPLLPPAKPPPLAAKALQLPTKLKKCFVGKVPQATATFAKYSEVLLV